MDTNTTTKKGIFKLYQIAWYVTTLIEALLAFRIIFRLLSANSASGFVSFVYGISYIFVNPFKSIFPSPTDGKFILDSPAIIAFMIYPVLTYLLVEFLQILKPIEHKEPKVQEKI